MKKVSRWALLALLVAGLGVGVVRALNKRQNQAEQAAQVAAQAQSVPVYELLPSDVYRVAPVMLQRELTLSGTVRALQSATVKSTQAGLVARMLVREGQAVKQGQVLAQLDLDDQRAKVQQAEQQVAAAQADVAVAQRTRDNNQALVTQGFISGTALDNANAQFDAALARQRSALAALQLAQNGLKDTSIRSPFNGTVATRHVRAGERVPINAPLLDVVDDTALEIEVTLPAATMRDVAVGQRALMRMDGDTVARAAVVSRINPSVLPGSRSASFFLKLQDGQGVRVGEYARGVLVVGELQGLALPSEAIRRQGEQNQTLVIRDGRVLTVPLTLGDSGLLNGESMTLAVAGLRPGDQVFRPSGGTPEDGATVRIAGQGG
ncbi:MAG: efflux RND transporter periplasmic adaptor subunit [Burkholderiaceae bacterium]